MIMIIVAVAMMRGGRVQVGRRHIFHDVLQRAPIVVQRQNGVRFLNVRVIADAKVHGNGHHAA